jgi:serine/threonine protein kinase
VPLGMLGKYERLDVLGHGASGIVYLAKDTLLGRQIALKEITAQGEDRECWTGCVTQTSSASME